MDMNKVRIFYDKRINKLFESGRPVIVIFKEKHCDSRFVCLDQNEFEQIFLEILWTRYHQGYYEYDPKPTKLSITEDDIETMKDGGMKNGAIADLEQYKSDCIWYEKSVEQMELITTSLQERDGVIAFAVLEARSGGEYEGLEIESAINICGVPNVELLVTKPALEHCI